MKVTDYEIINSILPLILIVIIIKVRDYDIITI